MLRFIHLGLAMAIGTTAVAQSTPTDALLDAATSLLEEGHYDEAQRTYSRVVDLDPTDLTARAGMVWSATRGGEIEAAHRASEAAVLPTGPLDDRAKYGAYLIVSAYGPLALSRGDTLAALRHLTRTGESPIERAAARPEAPMPSPDRSNTEFADYMARWRHQITIDLKGPRAFDGTLTDAFLVFATHSPSEEVLDFLSRWAIGPAYRGRFETLLRGLRDHPSLGPPAHLKLAWLSEFDGDHERTRVLLEEAARQHSRSYAIHLHLGDVQGETGRVEEALATFRALAQTHADSAEVQLGLFRARGVSGEIEEARRHLRRYEVIRGGEGLPAISNMCLWSLQSDPERPAAEVERCVAKSLWNDPLRGPTHAEVGGVYSLRGDYAEAADAFEHAVEYAPDSLDYQVALAEVVAETGDPDRAAAILMRVIDRDPSHGRGQLMLGVLLVDGSPGEAVEHLTAAAQALPSNAGAHFLLGRALSSDGRHEQAVGPLTMARTLAPDFPDAHLQLAVNYVVLGRFDDAERAAADLRLLSPEQADRLDVLIEGARARAAPQSPLGPGWTYAAASSSADHWVRSDPVSVSGSTRTVWVGTTAQDGQARAFRAQYVEAIGRAEAGRLNHILQRQTFDCSGGRSRLFEVIYYDASETPLETFSDAYPTWSYPAPGTVGEGLLRTACGR